MEFSELDLIHGSFTLLFVIITIIVGILISLRYFKYKRIEHLLIGIFWIGLTSAWLPTVINFLSITMFNNPISMEAFVIIGVAFLPFTVMIGTYTFASLLPIQKSTRNKTTIAVLIPNIIFEIYFLYFFFTDLSMIATASGTITANWAVFSQVYFIFALSVFLIMGIRFCRESLRADNGEIQLKGKFLLIAFISFTIGTILDFAFTSTTTYIIARLILVSSSLEFYIGFIMPKSVRNLFISLNGKEVKEILIEV